MLVRRCDVGQLLYREVMDITGPTNMDKLHHQSLGSSRLKINTATWLYQQFNMHLRKVCYAKEGWKRIFTMRKYLNKNMSHWCMGGSCAILACLSKSVSNKKTTIHTYIDHDAKLDVSANFILVANTKQTVSCYYNVGTTW